MVDDAIVAAMTDTEIEDVLTDRDNGVIHHRGKLFALRNNARVYMAIEREMGLSTFLWSAVPHGLPLCRTVKASRNTEGGVWTCVGGSKIRCDNPLAMFAVNFMITLSQRKCCGFLKLV